MVTDLSSRGKRPTEINTPGSVLFAHWPCCRAITTPSASPVVSSVDTAAMFGVTEQGVQMFVVQLRRWEVRARTHDRVESGLVFMVTVLDAEVVQQRVIEREGRRRNDRWVCCRCSPERQVAPHDSRPRLMHMHEVQSPMVHKHAVRHVCWL